MRAAFCCLTAALSLGLAAPALAECGVIDSGADKRVTESPELRARFNPMVVQDARQLRDAAQVLLRYDEDTACRYVENVVAAMMSTPRDGSRRLREEQRLRSMPGRSPSTAPEAAPKFAEAQVVGGANPLLPARAYIGLDLLDAERKPLGEVVDLAVRSDRNGSGWMLVNLGSFMRRGPQQVAIPVEALRIAGDGTALFAPFGIAQLQRAPQVPADSYDWLKNAAFLDSNDRYYAEALAAAPR